MYCSLAHQNVQSKFDFALCWLLFVQNIPIKTRPKVADGYPDITFVGGIKLTNHLVSLIH